MIVRIGRSVRFARLNDSAVATAIWDRLPHYGAAERTGQGALALALEVPELPAPSVAIRRQTPTELAYCLATSRIIFPAATPATTETALEIWATLAEPYSGHALDAVPHGARLSLLHADS